MTRIKSNIPITVRECGFCHIILVKWSNENSIQLPTLNIKQCAQIVSSLTCWNVECGLPLCCIHIHFQNFICWILREATGFRMYCWVKFMYCGERTNPISSLFSVNCTYALPLALWSLCISVGNASNSVKFSERNLILSYTRLSIQLSVPKIKFNHRWTTKDEAVENTGIFCGPSFSLCSTSSQYLATNNVFHCSFYQTTVHHPASVIQKNMFPHVQSPVTFLHLFQLSWLFPCNWKKWDCKM